MVEICLETAAFEQFSRDHYLSVRVGEAQKLARLADRRSFRFPASAVGSRKYGKVEIFQRVGSCNLCIDPAMAEGKNECEVAFNGTVLKFNAEVQDTSEGGGGTRGGANKVASGGGEEKKKAEPSMAQQKAMDYLASHHLEVRLADAMQQVLRERPDDPGQFLADILTKNSGLVAKMPKKAAKAKEASTVQLPPPSRLQTQAFGTYFKDNFAPSVAAGCTAGFFAKFATPPKPVFKQVISDSPPRLLPSMGSFSGPVGAHGGLCRFDLPGDSSQRESVGMQEASTGVQEAPGPAATTFPGRFSPSMGSFQGPTSDGGILPTKAQRAAASVAARPAARATEEVGAPSPKLGKDPFACYFEANFVTGVAGAMPELLAKFSRPQAPAFKVAASFKPSVATWRRPAAPRSAAAQALHGRVPTQLLPSVGTWRPARRRGGLAA